VSLLRARKNARHAKPSKAAPGMVAAGLTASFAVADVAAFASSASAASADDFARLRQCESGGNYGINTGNGFYGAYQFDRGTWNGLGYGGRAHEASPAIQDAAARRLQAQRGWGPWPACSRMLGLGRDSSPAAAVDAAPASAAARLDDATRASRSRSVSPAPKVRVAVAPTPPPALRAEVLSVADVRTQRVDVAQWQRRMAARGWDLVADGYFGPKTADVAKRFAAEKRLNVSALPGEVDRVVWDAAWRLAVT
jgi:hypothetical protein